MSNIKQRSVLSQPDARIKILYSAGVLACASEPCKQAGVREPNHSLYLAKDCQVLLGRCAGDRCIDSFAYANEVFLAILGILRTDIGII